MDFLYVLGVLAFLALGGSCSRCSRATPARCSRTARSCARCGGPAHGEQTHTVRVHMAALRRKIEANPARPRLLVTEPSVGYRLRDPTSD